MALRTMIIEDEVSSITLLKQYCTQQSKLQLRAICKSGTEALRHPELSKIDVIFLDVEMPGMNGFDFLDRCPYQPQVVITTSDANYAKDAYNYAAVDFLHKPISHKRFLRALQKLDTKSTSVTTTQSHDNGTIFIKDNGRICRIELDDLLYIENSGDYVRIVCQQEQYCIYRTMKSVMETLPAQQFMRIHRSFIINLQKIDNIEGLSLTIGTKVIPISRSYKSDLMQALRVF
ncbi:MAG: LytTR family DNA-binding domain-containing protein [Bacteroidota bacterium]